MAMDLGIPLLPVTIIGTRDILPPKSLRLFPGRVRMIIHPPIPVPAGEAFDIRKLMEKARSVLDPEQYSETEIN